jgi:hypothetical protein
MSTSYVNEEVINTNSDKIDAILALHSFMNIHELEVLCICLMKRTALTQWNFYYGSKPKFFITCSIYCRIK